MSGEKAFWYVLIRIQEAAKEIKWSELKCRVFFLSSSFNLLSINERSSGFYLFDTVFGVGLLFVVCCLFHKLGCLSIFIFCKVEYKLYYIFQDYLCTSVFIKRFTFYSYLYCNFEFAYILWLVVSLYQPYLFSSLLLWKAPTGHFNVLNVN